MLETPQGGGSAFLPVNALITAPLQGPRSSGISFDLLSNLLGLFSIKLFSCV